MQINSYTDKNSLRVHFKNIRRQMTRDEKNLKDKKIYQNLISMTELLLADEILTYISSDIEVDTERTVNFSFSNSKTVFAPRCISGSNIMRFYKIASFDDLESGYFGIREPKEYCEEIENNCNQICLVPALSYDRKGFRLGYGKGFYDRFLSDFDGVTIGLCYDNCIVDKLPGSVYDIPVNVLVTETEIIRFSNCERIDKQNR